MSFIHSTTNLNDGLSFSTATFARKDLINQPVFVGTLEVNSETTSEHVSDIETNPSSEARIAASSEELDIVSVKADAATQAISKSSADILVAIKILEVIETYGTQYGRTDTAWAGLAGYIPNVSRQVSSGKPISLLFSGFPFKSSQTSGKVLGDMPDLGEKLALAHLNGLCSNIAAVYRHGAKAHLCLEGLVYNGMCSCTISVRQSC